MGNALDYISWRGDLTFDRAPVNEIDIFLFAQIIAPDYTDIFNNTIDSLTLKDLSGRYFKEHTGERNNLGLLQSKSVLPSLKMMASSARYKNLLISRYVNKTKTSMTEQFCAFTVEAPGDFICIVFQGTDDTIIGWKEDFELASRDIVPSHLDAVNYLNGVVKNSDAPKVYICGHSKGGNLSLYSAVNADPDVRARITTAVSFDGPGFRDEFFESNNYPEMEKRLVTVLSNYSTVGLLLRLAGRRVIVRSDMKGPMAHDGFYWEVMGPKFLKTTKLSHRSMKFDRVLDDILLNMDEKARLEFTDELFSYLLSTGATTITELTTLGFKETTELIMDIGQSPKLSAFLKQALSSFFNT